MIYIKTKFLFVNQSRWILVNLISNYQNQGMTENWKKKIESIWVTVPPGPWFPVPRCHKRAMDHWERKWPNLSALLLKLCPAVDSITNLPALWKVSCYKSARRPAILSQTSHSPRGFELQKKKKKRQLSSRGEAVNSFTSGNFSITFLTRIGCPGS